MTHATWQSADAGAHTIGRWLTDRARQEPDAVAIDDRGVTITYGALARRSSDLARTLQTAGYAPGDRVATLTGNSIDHVVVFFACAQAALALVPLSWRLTAIELADLLERVDPAILLVEDEYSALGRDAVSRLGTPPPVAELGTTGVEAAVPLSVRADAANNSGVAHRPVRDDDPLLIIVTSGSAGQPKAVVLTHASCFWNNLALGQAVEITSSDVVLATLPQFHVAAWNIQPLLAWRAGATVVLERSFQPSRVLSLITERRVTAMMGVPTQYLLLAEDPAFADTDVSSLRAAMSGGSAMPYGLWRRWADRGVGIAQGYGLTEAGPNVLMLRADEAEANPGSVGHPYPYVEVGLRDIVTGTDVVGPGTGELWVRGPSLFVGYLGDAGSSAEALVDGRLTSGDLADRDAAGRFRIVGRLKDLYISGGENIAPAEIEAAIASHPLVEQVAVVGVPDEVWGEVGAAFVVPRSGAPLTAEEIRTYLRGSIAGFKIPKYVHVRATLPRTALGKIVRPRLQADAMANRGQA
ncbi:MULTISPECIES: class I adenylate-forming enzyme family protein [Mumia]|uniref:class I adenylate-forming enzyme family protein n=1 Tax=Mumia TaxID=1546255 RepID=UPI00141FD8A4|nr:MULTISPECIES: AMP-binding protein [unclassified Mumia]QMW65309.1 AMP-binding protein [Mumia sp. ZJ1417]